MPNKKNLPLEIKKPKMKKGEILSFKTNDAIALAWKDKRTVTMLSNWHSNGAEVYKRVVRGGIEEEVMKPEVVADYTKHMGDVDVADHYSSTYCFLRKSVKWWRKLFFWGLETTVINSYILYKEDTLRKKEKPMKHLQFVDKLILQLVANHREGSSIKRPTDPEERLNHQKFHSIYPDVEKKYRDCVVCGTNRKEKRKKTMYYCKTCSNMPALHIGECFDKYHTLKIYK